MTTTEQSKVEYDSIGRVKGEWYFDPVNLPALDERARMSGRTRQELIQEFLDDVHEKGWIWDFAPENQVKISLTLEQKRKLEEILDVPVLTGDALYNFVNGLAESPVKFGS